MNEFSQKTVVVTGAAGVLGQAVVDHFGQRGAQVAQIDIVEVNNEHFSTTCDLTDEASCQATVSAILTQFGKIDILANIAGGFAMGEAVHETTAKTWDFLFGLNAESVLNMARAVVPGMVTQKHGKIINIGALAGLKAAANMGAYSASKSVVIRLTESLAEELKTKGINVNCVMPSIIDTPRNRSDMPDADPSKWVSPQAMAGVIGFLASEAAAPIHGAAIPVTGLS